MASATQSSSLRADVEKAYRAPIPDETWEWLDSEHRVYELDNGSVDVQKVVEVIRAPPAALARQGRRVQTAGSRSGSLFDGLNQRLQALAEVIAWRAARNSTVVSFRSRHLAGGLIAPDEVTGWIDATYHGHRPRKWPAGPGPAEATNFPGQFALWPHAHLVLQWLDPTERRTKIWCVPTRGPLAELAKLSTKLADQWDWNLALATNFILTGEAPPRPGVRGLSFRTRRGSDGWYGTYEMMSVGCTIDVEVTPEELAAWWRGVRTAIGITGRKPMGTKAVHLALFALSSDDSTTFAEDMRRWNKQAPEESWRYSDVRNFRTACLAAIDSLTRPAAGCSVPGLNADR
jgi:hypothetical protein